MRMVADQNSNMILKRLTATTHRELCITLAARDWFLLRLTA